MAEQSTHPFPLFVAWGEKPDGESVMRLDFATERERSAYIAGIEDSDGWLGAAWNSKADWMLKFLETDCEASEVNLAEARRKFAQLYPFGEPLATDAIELSSLVDAAACLWEVGLDILDKVQAKGFQGKALEPWETQLQAARDHGGICEVRELIAGLAERCERDWRDARAADAFDDCFDWEFVPAWLPEALTRHFAGTLDKEGLPSIWSTFCEAPAAGEA